jgi:hypothetical protein
VVRTRLRVWLEQPIRTSDDPLLEQRCSAAKGAATTRRDAGGGKPVVGGQVSRTERAFAIHCPLDRGSRLQLP